MNQTRSLSYAGAINEALDQAMDICDDVFVFGQGVDRPPGVFQHASWAAGAVVIGRVFMPVFVEYTRRIAGSFATRSQPPA